MAHVDGADEKQHSDHRRRRTQQTIEDAMNNNKENRARRRCDFWHDKADAQTLLPNSLRIRRANMQHRLRFSTR